MKSRALLTIAIICLSAVAFVGQSNTPARPDPPFWGKIGPQNPLGRKTVYRQPNRARAGKPVDKPLTEEELEAMRKAEEEDRIKFGPPQVYHVKFQHFLNSETRGLVRLFPDKNCGRGATVSLTELERCADVPASTAGGSIYNFRAPGVRSLLSQGWLLHYANGKFDVGNDLVQSVITDIGDVDVESVDPGHNALKFLSGYDPKQKMDAILEQKEVLAKGISKNGYNFTNSIAVKNGSTYALRSVIYRYAEDGAALPNRGFDQYVVFKIAGIENDGSVIIIWKELKRDFPRRQIEM